jgi:hypothetical protein
MSKSKINFIIDALMTLCMAAIAGIGFLMEWVLVAGKDTVEIYGRRVELSLFGLDRHQWGSIHLYVAFALIALLVLHIILHWDMILVIYRKLVSSRTARWVIGVAFTLIMIALLAFPAFVRSAVEIGEKGGHGGGEGRGRGRGQTIQPDERDSGERRGRGRGPGGRTEQETEGGDHEAREFDIRGNMTIGEVSRQFNVPVDEITRRLGIAEKVGPKERLGWLRRDHNFTMSDVENAIKDYRQSPQPPP